MESGGFGIVNDLEFQSGNKIIHLLEKEPIKQPPHNCHHKLEEISIVENPIINKILNELCAYIIPYKFLKNKFYMLKGNGTLSDLRNYKLSISLADKIVSCLIETLKCLYIHQVYYFDIKLENIVYMCIGDEMYVWLVDLGSIIPRILDNIPSFVCTFPHPVFNLKFFDNDNFYKPTSNRNCELKKKRLKKNITPNLIPFSLDIYAYQLSLLFLELIGIENAFIYHTTMNNFTYTSAHDTINEILRAAAGTRTATAAGTEIDADLGENHILLKYLHVYAEIKLQLEKLSSLHNPSDITTYITDEYTKIKTPALFNQ